MIGSGEMETASARSEVSPVRQMLAPVSMSVQSDLSMTVKQMLFLMPKTQGHATTRMMLSKGRVVV